MHDRGSGGAMAPLLARGDAVLIVDVQRDFLTGGALAVPHGDEVVPVFNDYIARAEEVGAAVFASRDWHPRDHCSFHAAGGPWPPHCVADTGGARFAPGLRLPADVTIVSKGTAPESDAYSAFTGTDLAQALRARGIRRLWIGGLATDYCVAATVLDALAAGFDVFLMEDAIRAVDVKAGDGDRAIARMRGAGALPVRYTGVTT